ncbi:MAG: RDD family protein [Methanoregula sp.]|nr:RDD family protein [Methanoregula sp.]
MNAAHDNLAMAEEQPDGASCDGPSMVPVTGPGCFEPDNRNTLYLAKWSTRFWAWLIDFILVILFLNIVRGALEPVWPIPVYWDVSHSDPFKIGFQTVFFFLYWTVLEGFRGQSIGKMVMNLKVVSRTGSKIDYQIAALESLGKAFSPVLVLDCLIGWLGMPGTKLRVFNRISNTIVIKTDYKEPDGFLYVKDKE